MYKKLHPFQTPDSNTIVWRYLDFTKFIDLITNGQLYFCRSDKFEDPFEGLFQLKDYHQNREMFASFEETKKYYFLNSWHINNHQSDAMWRIFLDTKNGIAIKSTVGHIINALSKTEEEILVGKIQYRDFDNITYMELSREAQNQISDRGGSVNQYTYKRISFEHEKELRLYYIDIPIPHAIIHGEPREPLSFKKINIDVHALIEEVVIAPFAEDWFLELVDNVLKKLDYNFNTTKSDLYKLKY